MIKQYIMSRKFNTICCGFWTNMPVENYRFCLHNETIPDHFGKILRLYGGSSSMPFYYIHQQNVNTPFFEQLQSEGRSILERCYYVKRAILESDERFRHNSNGFNDMQAYLLGEADRFSVVHQIAVDMIYVYDVVTQIIDGMGK